MMDSGDQTKNLFILFTFNAFYMDIYEVTNAQYRRFVKETGHKEPEGSSLVDGYLHRGFNPWSDERFNGDNQPVVCVSWDGADDGYIYTAPVGKFEPNGYGLYDMAGNVSEWCADWFDSDYYAKSPKQNPKGPESGDARVVRSGSWISIPSYLRVAFRWSSLPNNIDDSYGFRCVSDVTP